MPTRIGSPFAAGFFPSAAQTNRSNAVPPGAGRRELFAADGFEPARPAGPQGLRSAADGFETLQTEASVGDLARTALEKTNSALRALPGTSTVTEAVQSFLESRGVRAFGLAGSGVLAVGRGLELAKDNSAQDATTGALGQFAVGTLPGTEPYAAIDSVGKLGTLGGVAALGQLTGGLGDQAATARIYGDGPVSSLVSDGARSLVDLSLSAQQGSLSPLRQFTASLDGGNIFERGFSAVGKGIGALGAAITTGSAQPFRDLASDVSDSFSTLGQAAATEARLPSLPLDFSPLPTPTLDLVAPAPSFDAPVPDFQLSAPEQPTFSLPPPEQFDALPVGAQDFTYSGPSTPSLDLVAPSLDLSGGFDDFGE